MKQRNFKGSKEQPKKKKQKTKTSKKRQYNKNKRIDDRSVLEAVKSNFPDVNYFSDKKELSKFFEKLAANIDDDSDCTQTKNKVSELQKNIQNLVKNSIDAILITDSFGNIKYLNESTTELFLRPAKELLGKTFGYPLVKGQVAEIEVIRRGGKIGIGEMRVKEMIWNGEKSFFVSILDVTERKNAQKSLNEYRENLDNLVENSKDGIIITDTDGKILFVNSSATQIFVRKKQELLGSTFGFPLFNGSATEIDIVRKWMEPGVGEMKVVKTSWNNQPAFLITVHDVTDRKRSEEELKESEERYKDLVEKSQISILMENKEGNFIYYNDRFPKLFGYSSKDIKFKKLLDLVHPDDKERIRNIHQRQLEHKKAVSHYDFKGIKKGKTEIYIEVDSVLLKQDDKALGIRFYMWDITDRKKNENMLKESLDEKTLLLSEIHHRVKNNLQIVHSLLNLQMSRTQNSEIIDQLTDSKNRILSMALIHEDLYSSENFAKIDFSRYIKNLVNRLSNTYCNEEQSIEFKFDLGKIQISIEQAIPCGLIINELVTNALKYAFPESPKEGAFIKVSFKATKNNELKLQVMDNGIGFPDEFDILQAKSLGLHLVQTLVSHQLNGSLELKRKKGTKFIIIFKKEAN